MKFTATEIGFQDGMGGASTSTSQAEYHYVLFGLQIDDQHPKNNGVYFEYDDQLNGSVDSVNSIQIADTAVRFSLANGKVITVICNTADSKWDELLNGIRSVFSPTIITNG